MTEGEIEIDLYFNLKLNYSGVDKRVTTFTPEKKVKDLMNEARKLFPDLKDRTVIFNCSQATETQCVLSNEDMTLAECGMKARPFDEDILISIVFDANGGTTLSKFPKKAQVKKTTCMIYQEETDCVPMDCRHYFSHEALVGWVKSTKLKSDVAKLVCPVPKCKKLWDFEMCLWYCNYENKDLYTKYYKIFQNRYSKIKIFPCPKCKTMNTRNKEKVKIYRLACGNCGFNFCDFCKQAWKKSGMVMCGNTQCSTYDLQILLNKCPMLPKDKNSYTKVYPENSIPSIRACPRCWAIINHKNDCLHMTCPKCEHEFCYACLEDWKPHGYGNQSCFNKYPHKRQELP